MNIRMAATAAIVMVATSVLAKEAPPGMSQFNRTCPAKSLLPKLAEAHKSCFSNESAACSEFVRIFRELLPEYDCQRRFDATPKVNYIVPAIWLAGDDRLDQYIALLSKLRTPEAQRLFASPEFRAILDGHFAEDYLELSVEAEKKLRK